MKRNLVAGAGATTMAVGLVGALVIANVPTADPDPPSVVTAGVFLALIPLGFVVVLEALIVWPAGGSYPLRRRATSVATALATALAAGSVGLLVVVVVRQALLWVLPEDSHASASGCAVLFGLFAARSVWLRLHTGRWFPASRPPNRGKNAGQRLSDSR